MGLLKFRGGTLVGCRILLFIQALPILHNFYGPFYMKNEKYIKNVIVNTFFHVFLHFRVAGSIESMKNG